MVETQHLDRNCARWQSNKARAIKKWLPGSKKKSQLSSKILVKHFLCPEPHHPKQQARIFLKSHLNIMRKSEIGGQ